MSVNSFYPHISQIRSASTQYPCDDANGIKLFYTPRGVGQTEKVLHLTPNNWNTPPANKERTGMFHNALIQHTLDAAIQIPDHHTRQAVAQLSLAVENLTRKLDAKA